jgi:hypothetical protein
MLFMHFANIIWASYISQKWIGDACSIYLLTFLLDSSLGLTIIYICLQLIDLLNSRLNWWMLRGGSYSKKHNTDVKINCKSIKPWLVQTSIFLLWGIIKVKYWPYFPPQFFHQFFFLSSFLKIFLINRVSEKNKSSEINYFISNVLTQENWLYRWENKISS